MSSRRPESKVPHDIFVQTKFENRLTDEGRDLMAGAHRIGRIVGDTRLTTMHVTLALMNHDYSPVQAIMEAADLDTGYAEKSLRIDLGIDPYGEAGAKLPYERALNNLAQHMLDKQPVPINQKKGGQGPTIGSMEILREMLDEAPAAFEIVLMLTSTAATDSRDRMQIMKDAIATPVEDSGQRTA